MLLGIKKIGPISAGSIRSRNWTRQELLLGPFAVFQGSTIPFASMQIYTATHARLFPRILFLESTCVSFCQEAAKGVPMAMPKRMAFTKYVVSRYKVVSSIAFNPFSYDFLLSPRVENVEKILNSSLHKENNL